jgi:hypothetical protein
MADITLLPSAKVPLIYPDTSGMTTEWYRFFWNVYGFTGDATGAVPVSKGGTGLTSIGNHQLIIGNAAGVFEKTELIGNGITITYAPGTTTLAIGNSGVTPGTYGSASAVGQFTVDSKGTLVFAQNVPIAIDATQIISGTIASARISGSYTGITGVGTLTAGTWNATTIGTAYGGTGLTSFTSGGALYATSTSVLTSGTLPVTAGGTGQTSFTNGQLLIGNTTGNTLTKATLTAGTGISISNGAGAITITNSSPSLGGDVVGPASATDNAIARFDTTTGKLIQNSVVTIGDTGAVTGFTTLSASTSVTTSIVQASNSAGLALKNAGGTTQMSVGAGGGDNMSINVSTNLNGTNAQIDISPTGTGHVHIKPSGTGAVEIAPTNAGTMNNMVIGGTTPLAITGTTITATTFVGSGASLTGVVTSVGATSPVTSSGGATPTIAMPAATTSVNGYLTSTDWNTFNSKQPAGTYVTSISIASSNGFTGTSSGGATPSLTLATSITGILKGNGTAISAATSGTDYAPATSGSSILYGNGAGGFSNVTIGTGVSFAGGTLSATGSGGTVTSVGGTGTVNGITLTGTVTSSGNLTLGGTLSGVSLSTQVTGTLPIANGGTGETTRQNAMDALAGAVTSGQYLRGNGTDVVMSAIQAADVPTLNQNTTGTASNVTGTVAVANGGTGLTSLTANRIPYGNGTSAFNSASTFVFDGNNLGIGTSSPNVTPKLTIQSTVATNGYGGIRLLANTTNANQASYETIGRRLDGNSASAFGGGVLIARVNTAPAALTSGIRVGRLAFGGSYDGTDANIVYGSQIAGVTEGTYSSTSAPTGIAFFTTAAATAGALTSGSGEAGTERMRIASDGIITMSAYGAGAATFSAAGVISSVSDETWKTKDGVPTNPDAMLQKLEAGYWFYNKEKAPIFGSDRQLGFYAQNVHEAIGEEAAPTPEEGKPWGYYDRSVLAITVMSLKNALNSIQELKTELDSVKAELHTLKGS